MSSPRLLADVSAAFSSEIREIEASFLGGQGQLCVTARPASYDPHGDGCVVSLWDAWNRFVRSLILTSCVGPCAGSSQSVYVPTVSLNEAQALLKIKASGIKVVRGEPSWFDAATMSSIVSVLALPNSAVIVGAIGASTITTIPGATMTNPLAEMRVIRNYIAHKSQRNLNDARSFMTHPVADVNGHIWEKTPGGIERFTAWTDGVQALADAACS